MTKSTVFLFAALLLAACNTVEGIGQDIEDAGEAVSDTATKVKKKISD